EALGRSVRDVAHSEDARLLTPEIMAQLSQGRTWSGEFRVERRDGSLVPTQATQSPVYGPRGELVGILGVSMDITERKRAEAQLLNQANLLNAVSQAVIGTDSAGIINYWNAAAEKLYGWSAEEALGRRTGDLGPPDEDLETLITIQAALDRGES